MGNKPWLFNLLNNNILGLLYILVPVFIIKNSYFYCLKKYFFSHNVIV